MSTNGIDTRVHPRRRSLSISGLALRVLIALIISWIIVLAFFVSGAVSH
jgi:hypothetical protein